MGANQTCEQKELAGTGQHLPSTGPGQPPSYPTVALSPIPDYLLARERLLSQAFLNKQKEDSVSLPPKMDLLKVPEVDIKMEARPLTLEEMEDVGKRYRERKRQQKVLGRPKECTGLRPLCQNVAPMSLFSRMPLGPQCCGPEPHARAWMALCTHSCVLCPSVLFTGAVTACDTDVRTRTAAPHRALGVGRQSAAQAQPESRVVCGPPRSRRSRPSSTPSAAAWCAAGTSASTTTASRPPSLGRCGASCTRRTGTPFWSTCSAGSSVRSTASR